MRILVPCFSFGLVNILIFVLLGSFAADRLGFDTDTSFSNLSELLDVSFIGDKLGGLFKKE